MYVDFGLIKYQCSCSFKNALNAQLIYSLSRNPGYDECGTAIQIKEINGSTYRMPCTQSTAPPFVISSQTTTVELACDDQPHCSDTSGYCLLVLSNNASVIVKGYCQSITLPPSSSETITTSTQSGSTNSPQSVPTHSTQSDTANSTQRINSQNVDITIALTKYFWFFLAGAGGIVLVIILAIIMIVKRRNDKKSQSKKELTENMYQIMKEERLKDDLQLNPIEYSASKADIGGSQNHQSDENRGSGYWMVENSFYLSADMNIKGKDDGHQNVLDINPSVYSEINDSENNVDYKNTAFEYDYAQVRGSQ